MSIALLAVGVSVLSQFGELESGACPPGGSCGAETQSCAKKFGATYTLLPTPEPFINSQRQLVINVEYASPCNAGGSMFTAKVKSGAPGMNALFDNGQVILAHRDEPECAGAELDTEEVVRDTLYLDMPASTVGNDQQYFIAFPPNGAYDMFRLEEEPRDGRYDAEDDLYKQAMMKEKAEMAAMVAPVTPEEEDAKIAEELETQTPEDSVNFLQHCEEKLGRGETCECCSPKMMRALRQKTAAESESENKAMPTDDSKAASIANDSAPASAKGSSSSSGGGGGGGGGSSIGSDDAADRVGAAAASADTL